MMQNKIFYCGLMIFCAGNICMVHAGCTGSKMCKVADSGSVHAQQAIRCLIDGTCVPEAIWKDLKEKCNDLRKVCPNVFMALVAKCWDDQFDLPTPSLKMLVALKIVDQYGNPCDQNAAIVRTLYKPTKPSWQ